RQSWLLKQREVVSQASPPAEDPGAEPTDPAPNPETRAIVAERQRILRRAVMRLDAQERLLIRLRYEEGLTLDQIGQLLELGNAQRVDRKIKEILFSLRAEFETPASGKKSPSSVKVT